MWEENPNWEHPCNQLGTENPVRIRPGISSLRGQGHFRFEKDTSIGQIYGKFLKGHQGHDKDNRGHGLHVIPDRGCCLQGPIS